MVRGVHKQIEAKPCKCGDLGVFREKGENWMCRRCYMDSYGSKWKELQAKASAVLEDS